MSSKNFIPDQYLVRVYDKGLKQYIDLFHDDYMSARRFFQAWISLDPNAICYLCIRVMKYVQWPTFLNNLWILFINNEERFYRIEKEN